MCSSDLNVSDTSGTPLPAGIYLFRATMSGEGGKLKTATKKLGEAELPVVPEAELVVVSLARVAGTAVGAG